MDSLKIILQNISGVLIIMAAVAVMMVTLGAVGMWLLQRWERRTVRDALKKEHADLWDGTARSELYCWLQIRRRLEEANANPMRLEVVNDLIDRCRQRHRRHREIMLETGRIIKTRKIN